MQEEKFHYYAWQSLFVISFEISTDNIARLNPSVALNRERYVGHRCSPFHLLLGLQPPADCSHHQDYKYL